MEKDTNLTEGELEHLKRRFGDDISCWPAPHRKEAQISLSRSDAAAFDDEDHLENLVLKAAVMETDEDALTRCVLHRVNSRRSVGMGPIYWLPLLRPATLAVSVTGLLVAAGVCGYLAGDAGRADDLLLALASGDTALAGLYGPLDETSLPGLDAEELL